MTIPSFSNQGGKARLRKWLISLFPKSGNNYIEAFAGRGNVFFAARQCLNFKNWILNDINVDFLKALKDVNLNGLPDKVDKGEEFEYWKNKNDLVSKVIEPRISFAGKGYAGGYNGTCGTHVGYSKKNYMPLCEEGKRLLEGTVITNISFEKIEYDKLTKDDFCYFDPPYFGTKAVYSNINHENLIDILNAGNFKWAISGYDSKLYNTKLKFKNKYIKERNSEIKSHNEHKRCPVNEILWTNYEQTL